MKNRMFLVLVVISGFALAAWPSSPLNHIMPSARADYDPCDVDGDGYTSVYCSGNDCDDLNPSIHPGATEYCNDGVDNDCDGDADMPARQEACDNRGWFWLAEDCLCSMASPVIVDTRGDGFRLTGAQGGVNFDINGDGQTEQLSWTAAGTDDALLALDRNGNGLIDGGPELLGNFTPQPPSADRNGFLALAEVDRPAQGGDGDGKITDQDAVFASLRLWRDANHNGSSEAGELHALQALGLKSIDLDYKESGRVDRHGNQFRYRAKVSDAQGAQLGRWAWDVFLVSGP